MVCGNTIDENVKNDIAIAGRLHITATTLDGIMAVKGQGVKKAGQPLITLGSLFDGLRIPACGYELWYHAPVGE